MFRVHDQEEFAKSIMPKYCRHTQYKSFLRQLSMYKFQRVGDGPFRGAYQHPKFRRNQPELCNYMFRGLKDAMRQMERMTGDFGVASLPIEDIQLLVSKRKKKTPKVVTKKTSLSGTKKRPFPTVQKSIGSSTFIEERSLKNYRSLASSALPPMTVKQLSMINSGNDRPSSTATAKLLESDLFTENCKPLVASTLPQLLVEDDILDEIITTFGSRSPSTKTAHQMMNFEQFTFGESLPLLEFQNT